MEPGNAGPIQLRGLNKKGQRLDNNGPRKDLSQATQLNPDSATSYFHRGVCCVRTGHLKAALADFDTALHQGPADQIVLLWQAALKSSMGDHHGAAADLDAAKQ